VNLREAKFQLHVLAEIERLRGRYNPTVYRTMIDQYGAVETAKRLLADPRSTSYGFEKLWELKSLEASVEYAVCLPWFQPLFTPAEVEAAERRLILHDFPVQERLERAASNPPDWAVDSALTDEDER
jgi:hypothetical protein